MTKKIREKTQIFNTRNPSLANWIQHNIKRITYHGYLRFISGMQGLFNMQKSIKVNNSPNHETKENTYDDQNRWKTSMSQISTSTHDKKKSQQTGNKKKRNFRSLIKGIYKKHTTNITLSGERWNAFSWEQGQGQAVHSHHACLTLCWRS